jgi:hypothetical protein
MRHSLLTRVSTRETQHSLARNLCDSRQWPLTPQIHASDALRVIERNILPPIRIVAVAPEDYRAVISDMASGDWRSVRIYDAPHLRCAEKQHIDRA